MKDGTPKTTDESLERVIGREVDSALARFRTGSFEPDVRRRIRERPRRQGLLARHGALLRPAWIVTAGIIFAGLLILLTHPRATSPTGLAGVIENVLGHAPVSRALDREWSGRHRASDEAPSPISGPISAALMKARQTLAPIPLPERAQESVGKGQKRRPMTLEEMYRILFIEKSIERALALTS